MGALIGLKKALEGLLSPPNPSEKDKLKKSLEGLLHVPSDSSRAGAGAKKPATNSNDRAAIAALYKQLDLGGLTDMNHKKLKQLANQLRNIAVSIDNLVEDDKTENAKPYAAFLAPTHKKLSSGKKTLAQLSKQLGKKESTLTYEFSQLRKAGVDVQKTYDKKQKAHKYFVAA
jgi:hypothetical protein